MMRMHHESAIDMANLELQKGDDSTLRSMAQTVINKQQAKIAELSAYLAAHHILCRITKKGTVV